MGLVIGVGQTKPTFAYDYYYGIEWDITVSNPKPTRIGKAELHRTLPLQNQIRRCILKDDGMVNYYLHANDSTKRDNGAAADLTGANGQFMDELPDMYVRFECDGNKCRHLQSTEPLPGFHLWRKDYVSAVEATVQRSTSKLASVVNTDADYRGGNNQSAWDNTYRSLLGRPASSISLTDFRAYARNRGNAQWNCNLYQTHRKLWWLFAVEYANFNSQDGFNAALDVNGYHQGGLGMGITNFDSSAWSGFNGYNPFVPCGITCSLGNHTGIVQYVVKDANDTTILTTNVPSYRGIENPFGHIWKWTDGCLCDIRSEGAGGLSNFYVCDNPQNFSSSITANYQLRGCLPRASGYITQMILGEDGEIMPSKIGGGSSSYFCDYFYTEVPSSGSAVRGVLFGASANGGTYAGFVYACTDCAPSHASASLGSRLCFYPQIEAA